MNIANTSWLELNTHEPEDAIAFYSQTLGWDFETTQLPQGGSYWVAKHNETPVGGVFCLDEEEASEIPPHWMTYLRVDDVKKAQKTALEAGGEVLRPALVLEGVGTLTIIADSTGSFFGLIEQDVDHRSKPGKAKKKS